MYRNDLIYHCSADFKSGGGIQTYLKSLFQYQVQGVSHELICSLENVHQGQFKLLHVHEQQMLWQLTGECPAVFTMHNHSAYCPSGTKYLAATGSSCDRAMSPLGCAWGHFIDGCGSRRPHRVLQNLKNSYHDLAILRKHKIPVIAISKFVQNQLIRHGIPVERVMMLHHGTSEPKTPHQPLTREIHQAQRILYAGRIAPYKGLDWLLKSLATVDPRIHLDIAGEGWDQPRIEKLAEELGIAHRIVWHGWCDSAKLEYLYQQCFALIVPSSWPEPAGLVTLEAYARYRPVIASNLGGIPDYVCPDKTGILVAANHINHLASAITELSSNFSKSKDMGEQGYALFSENFTMNHHVDQLQKIYEKVIESFFNQKSRCVNQFTARA